MAEREVSAIPGLMIKRPVDPGVPEDRLSGAVTTQRHQRRLAVRRKE